MVHVQNWFDEKKTFFKTALISRKKKHYLSNFSPFLGTRIIYERAFLMKMRHSPLAKTPPANLPVIPGVTVPKDGSNSNDSSKNHENGHNDHGHKLQTVTGNFTKKKS